MRKPLPPNELKDLIEKLSPLKVGFDALKDHVVITDENANILYANKAVQEQTGFSAQEVIGKNPADLWGGNMPKEFYEKMWQVIKTEKKPFVGEMENTKKDGTKNWQELHISPILNKQGNVQFFIAIEPNITDRKEKEKFKEEFISVLSHQVKNPLTIIKWALELVLNRGDLTPDQQEKLKMAYQNNESMVDLVSQLLIVSKIGSAVQKEVINLSDIIDMIISQIKVLQPGVIIDVKKDPSDFMVESNKILATEIFKNLISNAAEYCDKDHGQVLVNLHQENNDYIFTVENNGTIIPKEEQDKIFSKFFRASNAKDRKENGSGLGLFIVKMICDSFGWQISFKSPTDKGGGIIFTLKITT